MRPIGERSTRVMTRREKETLPPNRSRFSPGSRATATLLLVSAGLILVGGIGGAFLIERVKQQFYRLQADAERRQSETMARLLERDVENGRSPAEIVSRFQSSILGTASEGSYVCLLDENGILLSHPNPGMIGMSKASVPTLGLVDGTVSSYGTIVAGAHPVSTFATGDRADPEELVYFQPISGTTWTLASHENARTIEAQFRQLGWQLFGIAAPTVGLMALVGTGLSRAAGRRYERRIEEANDQLEERVTERTQELSRTLGELQVAHDRLVQGEKMHLLGELMAGIAHEIANPLMVVSGFGSQLANENQDHSVQSIGRKIEAGAERARKIVENLLAFARRRPPSRHSESIIQILERAIELISADLRRAGVALETDFPLFCAPMPIDAQQMEQVFLNLMNNARQALASHPGDRRLRIALQDEAENGVSVIISDTGPGLPDTVRRQVFQAFVTTRPDGTGLGLSLCRRFVEAHGGTIEAPLTPSGTEFRIHLPRSTSARSESRLEPELSAV